MRPGVNMSTRERSSSSVFPTDVSRGLMVGITESGPSMPTLKDAVRNIEEYETVYAPSGRTYLPGQRMYDAVDSYFMQGGSTLTIARVTGDAAAPAEVDVEDAAAAVVFTALAKGDGEWGNDLQIVIQTTAENPDIEADSYRIQVVRDADDMVLEESYDLENTLQALAWAEYDSALIELEGGVSALNPEPGVNDLAGGANDVAGIDNTNWEMALDTLGAGLGTGILMLPGITTDTLHQAAAQHANEFDRVYFGDLPDTAVAATLITSAKAVTDEDGRSRFTGMFGPWPLIPGFGKEAARKVPPSPLVAGLFAKNMANGLSANEPAAADNGVLANVLDFSQVYSDADRELLNKNGVNILRDVYGTPKVYGWRTTADPVNDKNWLPLSNTLLHRQIVALCEEVGERFVFRQIDGQKRLIGQFGAALEGHVCLPLFNVGSLFGDTPAAAYKVDVGDNVNKPETIADNQLNAVITIKMAPFGEEVNIALVKYLVTEAIPA